MRQVIRNDRGIQVATRTFDLELKLHVVLRRALIDGDPVPRVYVVATVVENPLVSL